MENTPEISDSDNTSFEQSKVQNVNESPTVNEVSIPKKINFWMVIPVVFFLLLLVGGVALGYLLLIKPKRQIVLPPASMAKPSSTPVADETENWKTYTNAQYSFSFKYPAVLEESQAVVAGPINGNPAFAFTLADSKTFRVGSDSPFDGFSVYVVPYMNIGRLGWDEYVAEEKLAFAKGPRSLPLGGITERKLTTGGLQVIALKISDDIEMFYVLTPNEAIVFSRNNANESFVSTFNKILSTLRLTAPAQSLSENNLKTLVFGNVSLKYPNTIFVDNLTAKKTEIVLYNKDPRQNKQNVYYLSLSEYRGRWEELIESKAIAANDATPTTLGSLSVYEIKGLTTPSNVKERDFVVNGKTTYVMISMSDIEKPSSNPEYVAFKNDVDQILSTFKFTNLITDNSTLQMIEDLTQPMSWSDPKADRYDYRNAHGDVLMTLQGQSITASIPEKSQDKLAPQLSSTSVSLTTYGWIEDSTQEAGGTEGMRSAFKKSNGNSTKYLIINTDYTKGLYSVFASN